MTNKLKALLSPFRYVETQTGGIRIERLLDKTSKSVIVPEGVTEIGYHAFADAKDLKKLYLPATLEVIGEGAFSNCRSMESVHVGDIDRYLAIRFVNYASTPATNGADFYQDGKLITSYTVPEGIESIGDYAFYGMRSLKEVVLPEGLKKIGQYAFTECGLTSLTLPSTLTEIGNYAFWYNREIPEVVIPEGVTELSRGVFGGCEKMAKITLPAKLVKIDGDSLLHTAITEMDVPEGVMLIGNGAFRECRALCRVTVPSTVKAIGDYTFYRCTALVDVKLPNGLRTIGAYAFSQCNSLRELFLPRSVTAIDHYAFASNPSLEKLYLPPYNVTLGRDIVMNCPALAEASTDEYVYLNHKLIKLTPYTETMGEIALSVEDASLLASMPLPKQVAFYRLKVLRIQEVDHCEAGRSFVMKTLMQSDTDALIVKGGVIVGTVCDGVTVLVGESKLTYYGEDNNGAGTKGLSEYSTLMFARIEQDI